MSIDIIRLRSEVTLFYSTGSISLALHEEMIAEAKKRMQAEGLVDAEINFDYNTRDEESSIICIAYRLEEESSYLSRVREQERLVSIEISQLESRLSYLRGQLKKV